MITITTGKRTVTISPLAAKIAAGVAAGLIGLSTMASGCASNTEPFNDAPISHKNDSPAYVGSMPDGFSNWASKCDPQGGGFRVFTAFHGDGDRAAIAVIADPTCR